MRIFNARGMRVAVKKLQLVDADSPAIILVKVNDDNQETNEVWDIITINSLPNANKLPADMVFINFDWQNWVVKNHLAKRVKHTKPPFKGWNNAFELSDELVHLPIGECL